MSRQELPSGGPAPSWLPHGGPTPFLLLLWVAAAYAAFQVLVGVLSWRGTAPDLVSLGAAEALAYTAVIFLLLHRYERGTPLRVALGLRPTHAGLVLAGVGLGLSLKLPAESLTDLIERFFPASDAQLVARAALYRTDTLADVLRLSFVTCLVAPLVEELFFRGALYGRLVKVSTLWAGLATGLSFVVVHADPRHWPALLVVSAALSYLRAASGSLLPSLALHVTFNAAGVLALVVGAVSPTRPLAVSWWATSLSWLAACLVSLLAVRTAVLPEATRARGEDRFVSGGIVLFLTGGGAAGAMYQIGALAALEDAIPGLNANAFDLFLGASSGASVAAALAAGREVRRIYRALLDPADAYFPLERKHILKMDLSEWGRAASTVVSALHKGVSSVLSRSPAPSPAVLWEELDRLYDSLPAGFFSLERYERFFADRLTRRGAANTFASLPRSLRVIAHDLDRGEEVLFGEPGFDHVPVTRACTASMALPPFFSPVCVAGRYFIDAGAAQARALEAAVRAEARAVVIVNPMVPVSTKAVPTGHGERASLRDKGAMWVANQAHRMSMQAMLSEVIERLRRETHMQVILIEPDPTDTLLFMYNPASFSARRAILEQAYRTTRERISAWPLARLSLMPQGSEELSS